MPVYLVTFNDGTTAEFTEEQLNAVASTQPETIVNVVEQAPPPETTTEEGGYVVEPPPYEPPIPTPKPPPSIPQPPQPIVTVGGETKEITTIGGVDTVKIDNEDVLISDLEDVVHSPFGDIPKKYFIAGALQTDLEKYVVTITKPSGKPEVTGQIDITKINLPPDYIFSDEPYDVLVKMATEGASFAELWEYIQKNPDAIRGAYASRLKDQIYEQLFTADELKGQEQFEAYKKLGFIKEKDAKYKDLGDGQWTYTSESLPTQPTQYIMPENFRLEKKQLDYIREYYPDVYKVIAEQGIGDAFRQYGKEIVEAINKSNLQQFESNLQEKSPQLYTVYQNAGSKQEGIEAVNKAILAQITAFNSIPKKYVIENRDGTVSVLIQNYIDDENNISILYDAGFDKELIDSLVAEVENREIIMANINSLTVGAYIDADLSKKTGLPEGSHFAGFDDKGNPTYYSRSTVADASAKEIEKYLTDTSKKDDARNDSIKNALLKLDLYKELEGMEYGFWGNYVDKEGKPLSDKDLTLMRWDKLTQEQKDKVAELYANDLYKTNQFAEIIYSMEQAGEQSYIYKLVSAPIILMGIPTAKWITKQPVEDEEIAIGGATAVLTLLSLGGGSLLSSAFGLGGKLATSAMVAGAGGIYTPSTIALVQNPDASVRDKAIAVAMNTLIFAGAFSSVVGLKAPEIVKTAKTTVAKAIEPSGVKVSLAVRIGEGISTTKTFFVELPNRVMSIPEAVKYYTQNLGLKAEQIADLARKGLLEVTPELANKIAVNIIKAGVNIENRILTAPEAIKYYTDNLGIKVQQLYELARRGLLEVTPQEAKLIADKIALGVVKFGIGIERRIMTIPEAIEYYTTELKLKSWQLYDIAKRGLLEVTPELADKIALNVIKAGINLENRIMSIPEAIKYYTDTLKIEAIHLSELARKGLLEVTPQQARMIADKIALNVVKTGVAIERRILTAPEAISYYAKELRLKASEVVKLAEKMSERDWDAITFDKVNEIVRKVQGVIDKAGERIVDIPELIDYYMKEAEIQVGKLGKGIVDKINTFFDEIYVAMRNKDRQTIIRKAHDLEMLSAEIPDEALSRIIKEQAQDLQKNADNYIKMEGKVEANTEKIIKNLEANEQRLMSYDEYMDSLRPLRVSDIEGISLDIISTERVLRETKGKIGAGWSDKTAAELVRGVADNEKPVSIIDPITYSDFAEAIKIAQNEGLIVQKATGYMDNPNSYYVFKDNLIGKSAVKALEEIGASSTWKSKAQEIQSHIRIGKALGYSDEDIAMYLKHNSEIGFPTETFGLQMWNEMQKIYGELGIKFEPSWTMAEIKLYAPEWYNKVMAVESKYVLPEYKAGELPKPKGDVISDTLRDIELDMKRKITEGEVPRISPEEMSLYKKISEDTIRLNEVYNKPGNERLIADIINRIQENTQKLAELKSKSGLQALEEFQVKLETRLKELGYKDSEISIMTETEKLDIVATTQKSGDLGKLTPAEIAEQYAKRSALSPEEARKMMSPEERIAFDKLEQDSEIMRKMQVDAFEKGMKVDDSLYQELQDRIFREREELSYLQYERVLKELGLSEEQIARAISNAKSQGGIKLPTSEEKAIYSRLKDLGYSDSEIFRMSDLEKRTITESSGKESPKIEKIPEKPTDGGGGIATKEKTEVKTEELTEQELRELKEKVKPEAKPEEKIPIKTATETKTTTETPTPTETPFRIPQVVGIPYEALVWENGRIVVKTITPEELTEGFTETRIGTEVVYYPQEETYEEAALRQRVTTEQWQKMVEEAKDRYQPSIYPQPAPTKYPEAQPEKYPQPTPTPYPTPEPTPFPQPQPVPVPEPQPTPVPQPQPQPYPQPMPVPLPTKVRVSPRLAIPIPDFEEDEAINKKLEYGFITWRQGKTYWAIPQLTDGTFNSDDKVASGKPFIGTTKFARGKGSVYRTLEYVGKNPPEKAFVDLGWAQYNIVKSPDGVKLEKVTPDETANWEGVNRFTTPEAIAEKQEEERRKREIKRLTEIERYKRQYLRNYIRKPKERDVFSEVDKVLKKREVEEEPQVISVGKKTYFGYEILQPQIGGDL